MGTCALVLNTCLFKHQYTLLQLKILVPLPLFTVALGDDVSGDMSRGIKLELQEWLGPGMSQSRHCGSEWCLSVCLLAWLKSYFIFLWDYQERVVHGRGTWQLLNLFLLQAQLTFSLFALFGDTGNDAISFQFYIAVWNINTRICCSLTQWPMQELLKTYEWHGCGI